MGVEVSGDEEPQEEKRDAGGMDLTKAEIRRKSASIKPIGCKHGLFLSWTFITTIQSSVVRRDNQTQSKLCSSHPRSNFHRSFVY